MPSLPDIPGKSLAADTGRRAGKVAAGAGLAMIAVGGYVVRHLLRRVGGGDDSVDADPISEPPTPQAVAEQNGDAPEPAPIEPADAPDAPEATVEEPPAPAVEEPSAPEESPAPQEPPAPEESPATDEPPAPDEAPAPEESPASERPLVPPADTRTDAPMTPTGTDAPQKPEVEPGDRSKDKSPHHALNNPIGDPDPTEWPDPYEKRDDPRDPADPDAQPFGEEPHAPTNAESTSEPHPSEDLEAGDRTEPPERDNLDD
jgi:hypothetical protein